MYEGIVSDIHINDVDPAIWSFWHSVLNDTNNFVDAILSTDITIAEWERQKEIYRIKNVDDPIALGFSAFFLNRTNRSGVIKGAGLIGGKKQDGKYKLDCRFNKENLIRRIRRIASYKGRINLYNLDAANFIEKDFPERSFFCIDPPYVKKGSSLYTSFYEEADHVLISSKVKGINKPWIVTYDDNKLIRDSYKENPQYSFDIRYSLNRKAMGSEILITSSGLKMPKEVQEARLKLYNCLRSA